MCTYYSHRFFAVLPLLLVVYSDCVVHHTLPYVYLSSILVSIFFSFRMKRTFSTNFACTRVCTTNLYEPTTAEYNSNTAPNIENNRKNTEQKYRNCKRLYERANTVTQKYIYTDYNKVSLYTYAKIYIYIIYILLNWLPVFWLFFGSIGLYTWYIWKWPNGIQQQNLPNH